MAGPFILPLSQCSDADLTGGKAVGLARLIAAGFPVPQGFCITTEAYRQCLHASGFFEDEEWNKVCALSGNARASALADCRTRIRQIDTSHLAVQWWTALQALNRPSSERWAIRSSATNEDTAQTSFAGLYRTHLGVVLSEIDAAVKDLWASLWEERVVRYTARQCHPKAPRMAVVIQPMVDAESAGVAYSIHPVTGRSNQVTIDAVPGLAAPLVDGTVKPDQYVVKMSHDGTPIGIRKRILAHKSQRLLVSKDEGLHAELLDDVTQIQSSLTDAQLFSLARTTKRIEQSFGHPIDLEWAFDAKQLWLIQARPITTPHPFFGLSNDDCEWSRANFKETLPELPSLLSLSFLERFMDNHIVSHYRRLGCRVPDGLTSVRVLRGRPYLNVTLFHILVAQLGGDSSLNAEQMGGESPQTVPQVQPLNGTAFVRALWTMWAEMRRVERSGPRVFQEMKNLAATYRREHILHLSVEELVSQLDKLGPWLEGRDVTFGIAGGVGQCLQIFSKFLPRWLGPDWRGLLNAALQGQGTVVSAQQILRLAELADIARDESAAGTFLTSEPWEPSTFREALAGTDFLRTFDRYLKDYGHRAVGESDVMSPRLADNPESILAIIRIQLCGASSQRSILLRQANARTAALAEIKRRIGRRLHRWIIFMWCYRRLCRFFALREANRHHLMYYSTAIRTLLMRLGELLVERGLLQQVDDIFFLTINDRADLLAGSTRDWKAVIKARRNEREHNAAVAVPDTIREWETASEQSMTSDQSEENGILSGTPISVGTVEGPVRVVRSVADWGKVMPGEILVVPVIDPGLAPLFGLVGGLIAEMGGTLSHGAIIAREYGLPTIANVEGAMARLADGQRITIDAESGTICIQPSPQP